MCRASFGPLITTLVEKVSLHNVERFVLTMMHVARRPCFWRDNTFKDEETSRGLSASNDWSVQVAECVPGGVRPGLVAHRQHKLPQGLWTYS